MTTLEKMQEQFRQECNTQKTAKDVNEFLLKVYAERDQRWREELKWACQRASSWIAHAYREEEFKDFVELLHNLGRIEDEIRGKPEPTDAELLRRFNYSLECFGKDHWLTRASLERKDRPKFLEEAKKLWEA